MPTTSSMLLMLRYRSKQLAQASASCRATRRSNMPTANNPLPLDFATLMGGQSTSYRIVAGADMTSANPLALQAASLFATGGAFKRRRSVTLNGHTAFVDSNGLTLLDPTMIRTGTGSIDIAAGNDVALHRSARAGGYLLPRASRHQAHRPTVPRASSRAMGDTLVTPVVNPEAGGNISISAQNDITGVENANKSVLVAVDADWKSDQRCRATSTQTSIDFGAFDRG